MFGQLGDDIIQGDGVLGVIDPAKALNALDPYSPAQDADPSFDVGNFNIDGIDVTLRFDVFEALADGDDYIGDSAILPKIRIRPADQGPTAPAIGRLNAAGQLAHRLDLLLREVAAQVPGKDRLVLRPDPRRRNQRPSPRGTTTGVARGSRRTEVSSRWS